MSILFHKTRPLEGRVTVARIRIRVDLPAPLGPRSPRTPGRSCRETFRKPQVEDGVFLDECIDLKLQWRKAPLGGLKQEGNTAMLRANGRKGC